MLFVPHRLQDIAQTHVCSNNDEDYRGHGTGTGARGRMGGGARERPACGVCHNTGRQQPRGTNAVVSHTDNITVPTPKHLILTVTKQYTATQQCTLLPTPYPC